MISFLSLIVTFHHSDQRVCLTPSFHFASFLLYAFCLLCSLPSAIQGKLTVKQQPASIHAIILHSLQQNMSPRQQAEFAASAKCMQVHHHGSATCSPPLSLRKASAAPHAVSDNEPSSSSSTTFASSPSSLQHGPALDKLNIIADLTAARDVCLVDPVRIGQIFGNLFSNACKFTPAGGHLKIKTSITNALPNEGDEDQNERSGGSFCAAAACYKLPFTSGKSTFSSFFSSASSSSSLSSPAVSSSSSSSSSSFVDSSSSSLSTQDGNNNHSSSPPADDHPRRAEYLSVVVSDDGAGIDAAVLPKLFHPFEVCTPSLACSFSHFFAERKQANFVFLLCFFRFFLLIGSSIQPPPPHFFLFVAVSFSLAAAKYRDHYPSFSPGFLCAFVSSHLLCLSVSLCSKAVWR